MRAAASGAAGAALQALGDEGVSHGAHVELVLRHAFDLLGSCCMHLPTMQEHMLDLLYRLASICITFSYFFMSVATHVYMAGWSCACSLHMHSSDSLAWLTFASATYSMLLLDQQCMVNNAKGGKLRSAFWQCMKWAGKCRLPKGSTAKASTALSAMIAEGLMWNAIRTLSPFQPKLLRLSQ